MKRAILYVDDESANLTNFKFLFQDDYTVYTALSAKDGLEILKLNEIHIVISDQRMPDMTGIEFLAQISTLYPDIIRILLTAYTETNEILDAINIGQVYQYITKPFQEKAIVNVLSKASEIWNLKEANRDLIVQLKAMNEEYEQVNEELMQSNEELHIAKEKAEESDRLKTAFLQNMSHEIRTPMNAIMGFSSLLAENFNNKEKLERFSAIIDQRCNELLDIINDILDISKIESGQSTINIEECNLIELFDDLQSFFNDYKERINKQHISLSFNPSDDDTLHLIKTDKLKLKQILINLISNALKFTQTGSVNCGFNQKNSKLQFFVRDTGIGIPADKHEFIFERFSQLEHPSSLNTGGTGLGLPIVKGLVNLLSGNVWVESESGKGTTFFFTIDLMKVGLLKNINPSISNHQVIVTDKTILIVEDDYYNAEYLHEILIKVTNNLITVHSGTAAIENVRQKKIDIILMDIRLPDMSGIEAIKLILKEYPNIKIIAQTAYAAEEEQRQAFNAGCTGFLSKPTRQEDVIQLLGNLLNNFN